MKHYKTLLAVVPAKVESSPSIQRAAGLARASGAALHLCSFVYDPAVELAADRVGSAVAAHVRHDIMRERKDQLERLAANLAGKGHPIECEVVWAPDEAEAVLAKALDLDADLALKDAHHEPAPRRALFTPLDWKLMRTLPCPLMLVGPAAHAGIRRVAAAIDVLAEPAGADGLNTRVLDAAMRLSGYLGAQLDLVAVFAQHPDIQFKAWPGAKAVYAEEDAAQLQAFTTFADLHGVAPERRHRLAGTPSVELARFAAQNQIDVLVVGSSYRSRWNKFLLGSTTESLSQQLGADLMLIKPADFMDVLGNKVDLAALRERCQVEQQAQ